MPKNGQATPAVDTPAREVTSEEAATLSHEGEAVLREMGEEQLEPPAPFDFSSEHVPDPGDVVVPFEKIKDIVSEKKPEHRGRPAKADKAEQTAALENAGRVEGKAAGAFKTGKAGQTGKVSGALPRALKLKGYKIFPVAIHQVAEPGKSV